MNLNTELVFFIFNFEGMADGFKNIVIINTLHGNYFLYEIKATFMSILI